MKRVGRFLAAAFAAVSVVVVFPAQPVSALSGGCDHLNSHGTQRYISNVRNPASFAAGERIVITAALPTNGNPTGIVLKVNGVTVDTASFPGALKYRFTTAATGVVLSWSTTGGTTPQDSAFWTPSCAVAPNLQSLPGVVNQSTNFSLRDSLSTGPATIGPIAAGARPQVPIMGDWNDDFLATIGYFAGGTFFLRDDNSGPTEAQFTFGDPRGFPVVGDFNGDGKDDVAVFRDGLWQVRLRGGSTLPAFSFGTGTWPNTVPVAGDWNNDGIDGIGTYNLATGTWNLRNSASAGAADFGQIVLWLGTGSYPVVGDWNADGTDTLGVRKGTTWTLTDNNLLGQGNLVFDFGGANELPVIWTTNVVPT